MNRSVGVWKHAWLPYSETFVVDQLSLLERTETLNIGYHNLPDGLMTADYAPYPYSFPGKAARVIGGVRPFMHQYLERCRSHDIGLIHAHFGVGGPAVEPLARSLDVPILMTFHGGDDAIGRARTRAGRLKYHADLKRLFKGPAYALAVSQYVKDEMVARGMPEDRIRVHYTGTRITDLVESGERSGIVFVGRLIPIKGCIDFLKAAAALPADLRSTPITVVGYGEEREQLEVFAREQGLNATFLGRLASDEIPPVLARHSVFCGPSLPSPKGAREGFGMTFAEASMQALPVVAYASGGVAEAVEHGVTGLLAEEHDVAGLTAHLEELLRNPEIAAEMGRAGRRRTLDLFDVKKNTGVLETIYEDLAAGHWDSPVL